MPKNETSNSDFTKGMEHPEPGDSGPVNHLVDPTVELRRSIEAMRRTDARHAAKSAYNTREKAQNQKDVLNLGRKSSADVLDD